MAKNPDYRPTTALTPAEARAAYLVLARAFGPPPEVAAVADHTCEGPAGPLPLRVYSPEGPGPHPVLVYFHGGGWVIGDLDTHDRECRVICNEARCIVVAVDYRCAPEHPFPAAVHDAWAALSWVATHAAELGADEGRLAVGGDSAGGNLAAVVALRARDEGGPNLRAQVLVYPSVAGALGEYPSHQENEHAPFLSLETMRYFRSHYLGPDFTTTTDWKIAPIHAASHRGLPTALILTAEFDPLRDEGRDYARRLEASGVSVRYREYAGMPHMFFQLSPVLQEGKDALSEVAQALRQAFAV